MGGRNFTRQGGGGGQVLRLKKNTGNVEKNTNGGHDSWLKKVKRCVECVLAPSPTTGGPAAVPLLGLGMGVMVTRWVTGNPPPNSSGKWWGSSR